MHLRCFSPTVSTGCLLLCVASILGLSTNVAFGALVTLDTSADTFITDHSGGWGPDSNHNNRGDMWCITDLSGYGSYVSAYPMVLFDLSAYAGQTVLGDATFQGYLFGPTGNGWAYHNDPRQVRLGAITQDWNPATVTYNIFGSPLSTGVDWSSGSVTSITWSQSEHDPRYVTWTVPQAIVQGWMDDPSTNHGVMLRNESPSTWNYDLMFHTLEYPTLPNPPQLIFSTDSAVIPEPFSSSIWALLGLFGVAMAWRGHRSMRKTLQR